MALNKSVSNKKKRALRKIDPQASPRNRLIFFFAVVAAAFVALAVILGYYMIYAADFYAEKALAQQTRDVPLVADRGQIFDSNMNTLAINEAMKTLWVRPEKVKEKEEKSPGFAQDMADTIAVILGDISTEDVYKVMMSDSKYTKIKKYVDADKAEELQQAIKDEKIVGCELTNIVRRYYPMGTLACQIIGTTNDDNVGISGLEMYYDKYLNGNPGRWIRSTDVSGRKLTNGIEKYYPADDGRSIVLTIDEVIQHFTEQALQDVFYSTGAKRAMAIVMDPKNGDILSMATYPGFNLNDPRGVAVNDDPAILDSMTTEEKVTYWNKMWKNPLVNELYEPGSPFKLITTAAALEEGLTNTEDTFVCAPIQMYDVTLNCWKAPASHGTETLVQGVANSCNPVFITLAGRLGLDRFYNYLDLFGINKVTGIDFPGEATSIIQTKADAGPVGLATMGYGQGIAVTPIQLITALSAIGNDGKMMQPRLVKALADAQGNITETFEPKVVRQVISTQTASEVASMMEGVVNGGTGSAAYIPGMRVGGKTGTAQKVENGMYTDQTYSSFFAMAPMDDPKVAVLVIVDSPQGVHYGSQTAGPGVKAILSDVLNYLAVQPVYTEQELATVKNQSVSVPDFTGYLFEDAVEVLHKLGLSGIACPTGSSGFTVVDQYPKPGTMLYGGKTVCLYAQ